MSPELKPEMRFAKKLRELRKAKGLTQERLAERAGLEYKYIQMLEGKKPPSATLRTLGKLGKAFGLSITQLTDFSAPVPQRLWKAAEKRGTSSTRTAKSTRKKR